MAMKSRVSCTKTTEQWKALLQLSQVRLPPVNDTAISNGDSSSSETKDPFDCSDVAVPPAFDLVEQVVKDYQIRWKQLDDRKLVHAPSSNDDDDEEEGYSEHRVRFDEGPNKRLKKPKNGGWRYVEDRLRLPYNFDYATTGPEPEDDGTGERVLSLTGLLRDGPTQQNTSSYEQELWKLFSSIPSVEQLEQDASAGAQLDHTLVVQREIKEMMRDRNPPDAHLLLRMRMADRHGLPPTTPSSRNEDGSLRLPDTATIRIECWRRQPKRHPSPDPARLVLEFLADQTLLDLHSALMQMAEDDLWDNVSAKERYTQSGCFFIEEKFYTHGSIDYAKPIIDWIDAGSDKPHPARRGYLGMSSLEKLETKPMKDTRLGEIPMRLGYRYYHACHGDVETSLCLVDRRWTWKEPTPYPIIHDIWTPSANIPLCEACKVYTAAFITSATCTETDCERRTLCETCRRRLKIPTSSLHLYSSWRDEAILSTSLGVRSKRKF